MFRNGLESSEKKKRGPAGDIPMQEGSRNGALDIRYHGEYSIKQFNRKCYIKSYIYIHMIYMGISTGNDINSPEENAGYDWISSPRAQGLPKVSNGLKWSYQVLPTPCDPPGFVASHAWHPDSWRSSAGPWRCLDCSPRRSSPGDPVSCGENPL